MGASPWVEGSCPKWGTLTFKTCVSEPLKHLTLRTSEASVLRANNKQLLKGCVLELSCPRAQLRGSSWSRPAQSEAGSAAVVKKALSWHLTPLCTHPEPAGYSPGWRQVGTTPMLSPAVSGGAPTCLVPWRLWTPPRGHLSTALLRRSSLVPWDSDGWCFPTRSPEACLAPWCLLLLPRDTPLSPDSGGQQGTIGPQPAEKRAFKQLSPPEHSRRQRAQEAGLSVKKADLLILRAVVQGVAF